MNTDKNILIAEFCAFQKTSIGWYDAEEILNIKGSNTFDELLFDESLDWLIPVVRKIIWENMGSTISKTIQYKKISRMTFMQDINFVYARVIEFIDWFNKNSK